MGEWRTLVRSEKSLDKGFLRMEKGLSEMGAPKEYGCTICGVWTIGGHTKAMGHIFPRASPNSSRFIQGGRIYKWVKAKTSQGKEK
jgi:hypothetical protein